MTGKQPIVQTMSDWEDDMSLDGKLGPEHLGYMRLGSEVAKLANGINWDVPKSGAPFVTEMSDTSPPASLI